MNTLIVVDYQNDFITGTLQVPRAIEILPRINDLIAKADRVITTQDWHPRGHCSFKQFPEHCIARTWGSALHPYIQIPDGAGVLLKGQDAGVEGYAPSEYSLRLYDLSGQITVCGLAFDYSVSETAATLFGMGLDVSVDLRATREIDSKKALGIVRLMLHLGIKIV